MRLSVVICPLLLAFPAPLLAQDPPVAGLSAAFAAVTGVPVPLQSTSGRFSSLNPVSRHACSVKQISGRVVSAHLIMVDEKFCSRGLSGNVLVNVEFRNRADAAQMIVGRRVGIAAVFKNAEEKRTAEFYADYLIAEKAELVDADPPAAPAPAFTSYMICQPPELDALARKLGSELCVQNTLVANLPDADLALEKAARAPGSRVEFGSDDPNAIICVTDLERSDVHLPATACAKASYWSWYQAKWRDRLFLTPAPP